MKGMKSVKARAKHRGYVLSKAIENIFHIQVETTCYGLGIDSTEDQKKIICLTSYIPMRASNNFIHNKHAGGHRRVRKSDYLIRRWIGEEDSGWY